LLLQGEPKTLKASKHTAQQPRPWCWVSLLFIQ